MLQHPGLFGQPRSTEVDMSTSSTSCAVEAPVSPATLRCPPSGAAPAPSAAPVALSAPSTALRLLRASWALLVKAERIASNGYLPAEERARALVEAQRHLDAGWRHLVTLTVEEGSSEAASKAAVALGGVNRRLPLIASELRGVTSMSKEAALWPPPLASCPCAPCGPSEALAATPPPSVRSRPGRPRGRQRRQPRRPPRRRPRPRRRELLRQRPPERAPHRAHPRRSRSPGSGCANARKPRPSARPTAT